MPDEPPTTRPGALDPPDDVPAVSAERLVDGRLPDDEEAPDAEEAASRRYPSTIGGMFYLVMLAVAAAGLAVVVLDGWRVGVRLVGGALLFGAVVRVVLPGRDAGMLAVRSKLLDALFLGAVGVALFALAGTIPDQPLR